MTTIDLYKKHLKGEISKGIFLTEVRKDSRLPWILNTTSYTDAVKILKNKGIIAENLKEEEETTAIIDRLNPYAFKHAMEEELSKSTKLDMETIAKARKKVAKKLSQDKDEARYGMFGNVEQVKKMDKQREMQKVAKNNHKDEHNQMKKVKGQEVHKANTKTSTKENKKGKPKGVKEMTYNAKKAKGISKVMEKTGSPKIVKESVLEAIILASKKKLSLNEDSHHEFGIGQKVSLPEKDIKYFSVNHGIIKHIVGGTLTIELPIHDEENKPIEITRQVNVIKHANSNANIDSEINEDSLEKHSNKNGKEFQVGQKAIYKGKEVIVRGFHNEDGKIEALIDDDNNSYSAIDIDKLDKVGEEKDAISDKEYRDRVFNRLPNYNVGQGWLSQQVPKKESRLDQVVKKLKEIVKKNKKKEIDEADLIQAKDQQGNTINLDTVPTGQGNKEVSLFKKKGIRTATKKTMM